MKDLVLTGVTDDLDQAMMIHVFQHELSRVPDKNAPMVPRKLPVGQPKLWFNEDIKNKNRKHEEERGYGESTRRIPSGWPLKF